MECETICYNKRHYFPMHLHPDLYTFSFILGGSSTLICRDFSVLLKENDLVIIPPYMAHQTIVENYFYYKVIRVPKSYSFMDDERESGLRIVNNGFAYLDCFNSWYAAIRSAGRTQNVIPQDIDIPKEFTPFLKQEVNTLSSTQHTLKSALIFLNNNYYRPIHLEELSEIAFLSSSHFQRLFKSHLGISPMRYLLNLRIEKAKAFIKTKDTFTNIAFETGFYDQSHFNKYFKTHVGMIPKRYAAIVKND